MPLETALTQMLSRITPFTAIETLPLVNCFAARIGDRYRISLDVPGDEFQLWMVMRYAWRICPPISRTARRGKAFAGRPLRGGLRLTAFAL